MNLGENVSHPSFHAGTGLTLHSTVGALDLPSTPQKLKWVGTHLLPPLCGDALIDLKMGKRENRGDRKTVVSQTTTDQGKLDKRDFGPKMTLQQLSMQMSLSLGAL